MGPKAALPDRSDVHVWSVELAASPPAIDECSRHLSVDEHARAARYRFEHLRSAFILARGILRVLIGRYLDAEPGRLRFDYGLRGKPRLVSPDTPLAFNLSHSGTLASYAFATGCELGVDIEEMKAAPDQEGLVRRFFSPGECEDWLQLEPDQRNDAFYRCWTRKEAYIKALGDGLSLPLDSFRVSLRPGEPAALLWAAGDAAADQWSLHTLSPGAGYAGALALPDRARRVLEFASMRPAEVLDMVRSAGTFPAAGRSDAAVLELNRVRFP